MNVTIKKWGNSYGIRIPKLVMQKLKVSENEILSFNLQDNKLILEKSTKKEYTLDDVMANARIKKMHKLIDFGEDVGSEIWQ